MNQSNAKTLYRERRTWFFAALSLVVAAVLLYTYFLSASIVHVVMRKEVEQEINVVSSKVSQLEAEYIELQHAVSAEIASLQGYVAADDKVFIDRTRSTLVVSRTNGI